jgi:hypothetical protein
MVVRSEQGFHFSPMQHSAVWVVGTFSLWEFPDFDWSLIGPSSLGGVGQLASAFSSHLFQYSCLSCFSVVRCFLPYFFSLLCVFTSTLLIPILVPSSTSSCLSLIRVSLSDYKPATARKQTTPAAPVMHSSLSSHILTCSLLLAICISHALSIIVLPNAVPHSQQGSSARAFFQQLLDHSNPEIGTFSQLYYWDTTYWQGPTSPIIVFAPQEAALQPSFFGNNTAPGKLAQITGAAVLLLEHRYWGSSSPFDDLTVENLQYLTLNNSIADLDYFAQHVQLPFDADQASGPYDVPWILLGASYSAALTAFVAQKSPGTYWAYYSSSGVVQSQDNWQYFVPIQEAMPQNCSTDIKRVVERIDDIGVHGSKADQESIKDKFGLGELEFYDDFAA